jgi:hypothetical protein
MLRTTSLLLLAALSPLAAQTTTATAHPQDTTQNSNGNLVPFGCLNGTTFTDGHCQVLIRGLELPGPGAVLTGMEVHCQGTLALTYSSLNISVSATTATSLGSNFASNLPVPQTLLTGTNVTVNYVSNAFASIPLTGFYVHDGTSSLVLDIQKVVNPATAQFATMSTTSNPPRNDLPSMAYAFGGPGSGASLATTATTFAPPLSVRLLWLGVPTIHLLANPAPSGNQYGLGSTITLTTEAAPGSVAINFLSTAFLSPFQALPPVVGEWRVQGITLNVAVVPGSGAVTLPINVPNATNLVGLHLCYQSGAIDPTGSIAQFTNATDHVINP